MDDLEWKCTKQIDIVHLKDGKWFFWDEVYCTEYGPFDTEQLAQEALNKYCIEELGYPE